MVLVCPRWCSVDYFGGKTNLKLKATHTRASLQPADLGEPYTERHQSYISFSVSFVKFPASCPCSHHRSNGARYEVRSRLAWPRSHVEAFRRVFAWEDASRRAACALSAKGCSARPLTSVLHVLPHACRCRGLGLLKCRCGAVQCWNFQHISLNSIARLCALGHALQSSTAFKFSDSSSHP